MDPVVRAASASGGGGFQYTPPSYLLRASDTTNRPWNYNGSSSSANNNEGDFYGNGGNTTNNRNNNDDDESENEYDLPQEQRPQTRRESYVDAHFHQRVRTKQSRYRDIITGVEEISETSETEGTEHNASNKKPNSVKLRSSSEPTTSSNIDAETVRNLRAHRLRSSLLKPTSDDYDLQTKLELRRLKARKDDSERAERASLVAASEISERKALENERKTIQEERKALAIAKEEASYALKRASQINEERRKQRELDAIIEMNRLEDEKITKRREQQRRRRRSSSRNTNNRSSMKTKSFKNTDNDNDDDFTLFDLDNDFAFLNDISGIVRDSSLMKGCLSVTTGCFGSTSTCNDLSSDTVKEDTIIDNTAPDLVRCSDTSHSDIEGDENNNGGDNGENIIGEGFGNSNQNETNNGSSLRRSRLSAQYRV